MRQASIETHTTDHAVMYSKKITRIQTASIVELVEVIPAHPGTKGHEVGI